VYIRKEAKKVRKANKKDIKYNIISLIRLKDVKSELKINNWEQSSEQSQWKEKSSRKNPCSSGEYYTMVEILM